MYQATTANSAFLLYKFINIVENITNHCLLYLVNGGVLGALQICIIQQIGQKMYSNVIVIKQPQNYVFNFILIS